MNRKQLQQQLVTWSSLASVRHSCVWNLQRLGHCPDLEEQNFAVLSVLHLPVRESRLQSSLGALWDSVESGGLFLQHRLSKESYSPVHFSGSPEREDKAYENSKKDF